MQLDKHKINKLVWQWIGGQITICRGHELELNSPIERISTYSCLIESNEMLFPIQVYYCEYPNLMKSDDHGSDHHYGITRTRGDFDLLRGAEAGFILV